MAKWIAGQLGMKLGGGYIYTECQPGDDAGVARSLRADSLVCGQHVDSSSMAAQPDDADSCVRFWYTSDRHQHMGNTLDENQPSSASFVRHARQALHHAGLTFDLVCFPCGSRLAQQIADEYDADSASCFTRSRR